MRPTNVRGCTSRSTLGRHWGLRGAGRKKGWRDDGTGGTNAPRRDAGGAGRGGGARGGARRGGGRPAHRLRAPIDTLNPFAAYSAPTYFIYNDVYDLLINFDTATGEPDLEHSPAESFETSTDGKVWTYHLRPGVKWADGEPFTAEDVRWTFQTVIDTRERAGRLPAGVTKVEAVDDLTVRLTLTSRTPR